MKDPKDSLQIPLGEKGLPILVRSKIRKIKELLCLCINEKHSAEFTLENKNIIQVIECEILHIIEGHVIVNPLSLRERNKNSTKKTWKVLTGMPHTERLTLVYSKPELKSVKICFHGLCINLIVNNT